MQAEDAALRRIDDWRREHRAVDAAVGDRKGAPLEFLELEFVLGSPAGEVADRLLDLGEREHLRVADHRHDEALAATDGDSDVVVVAIDDVRLTVLRVHLRNGPQRLDRRPHEERHETELHTIPLLELILELAPQRHHGTHVALIERRQQGCLLLGLDEPLRDPLADRADELVSLLAAAAT